MRLECRVRLIKWMISPRFPCSMHYVRQQTSFVIRRRNVLLAYTSLAYSMAHDLNSENLYIFRRVYQRFTRFLSNLSIFQ